MAEFDDERPDFDAVFRDPPGGDDSRAGRRRASRRSEPDPADYDDSGSTGEVPRPRAGGGGGLPPLDEPAGFTDFDDEPEPRPSRSSRGSRGSSRSRPSTARSRAGGGGRPPRSRGGGRGGGGVSGGAAVLQQPRARLLLGIAFAVVLVIVIALVVKDCQRSQLEDSYTQYVNGVAQIVTKSAAQGAELRQVMANPRGDKPPQLKAKISAIAKEAQALVDQADDLDPPGSLSTPQQSLVAGVLEYRVTGLRTLAENLPTLLQGTDQQTKASGVAQVMKRFLASDVIYEDSFAGPATQALKDDDITGIKVPPLQAFLPNAGLASPEGAKSLIPDLQRRVSQSGDTGTTQSGNLRGMSLESTVAAPSDTRLTPGETASVQSTELLKWQVTVKNGGDFDESNVIVKASFFYPASPNDVETREVAIPTIASGESTTVELPGPSSEKVVFGDQGTLKIEVVPVTGETRVDNNSAEYPVKITI
jgi:hypothetical protein